MSPVDMIANLKQYLMPALVSLVAIGLLKMGLFVTFGDLENSLRKLESAIRYEYATKEDIQDIKLMLTRMEHQLEKLDNRLSKN